MFIITNTTATGEYTPSKAKTFEEAQDFMYETTFNNYAAVYRDFSEFSKDMNIELCESYADLKQRNLVQAFIEWLNRDNEHIHCAERATAVYYNDDSFNKMTIYDIDKL